MAKPLPRFVARFISQNGSVRYRFRRKGHPSYYFLAKFGTKRFEEEYEACLKGAPLPKEGRRQFRKPRPKTIEAIEGRIYFISDEAGPIKIGFSEKLKSRLAVLQIGSPCDLSVLASIKGTIADERDLHKRFSHCRIRGEWFARSPDLMAEIATIKSVKASHLIPPVRQKEG